jgi:hypothetical protein
MDRFEQAKLLKQTFALEPPVTLEEYVRAMTHD